MQKQLPDYLAPRDTSSSNKKDYKYIPKKIFQTYKTNQVSSGMYDAVYTCIDKNPDWEYHFFDNDDCRNFIKDNFPKKVLDAYDTLIPGAYKADLWRYCILYIHGGVYADIKLVLNNQLDKLIDINTQFTSVKERWPEKGGVHNSFLCSMPKHKFLKSAIDLIVYNVNSGYFGEKAISPTGPFALGMAINLVLGRNVRKDFKIGFQRVSGFEFTLWFLSRKHLFSKSPKIHTVFLDRKHKDKCFHTRYKSYGQEKKLVLKANSKKDYGDYWENFEIYDSIPVDRKKILYPVIFQVKKAYKNKNYKKARKLIKERFFKYKQFKLVLFRCLVQYEILIPILRIVK